MGSKTSEHVGFVLPLPEPVGLLENLRAKFPDFETTYFQTAGLFQGQPDKEFYKDKTILVTLASLPPSVADAPNLRHIHFIGSGTDHSQNHPVYKDPSIKKTSSRGVAAVPIAEWVIMTALAHGHQYNRINELQRSREWGDMNQFWSVRDMVSQRIGILGYGGIGRHVGRVAKAMGMDVYAFTATPKDTPEQRLDRGYGVPNTGDPEGVIPTKWYSGLDKPSLHEFLKQDLDIVVLALPLTEQTTKLFSKEEFEILSAKKALVINVSRGAVIDQPSLIQALEEGKLRGAALDVADPEPLPSDHPLWTAPNVIISPHMSGIFSNYFPRAFELLSINLERNQRGEKMLNVIH